MNTRLHLLGGAGRIGNALLQSLIAEPLKSIDSIFVYCDSTKTVGQKRDKISNLKLNIRYKGYAAFNPSELARDRTATDKVKHIVINLRGVNNKLDWLNQPLSALELQVQACRTLTESELWMLPEAKIIHLSSQLCDLIEGPHSLDEICEGQESYRRPYMVSRLHQEAMLTAYAYQHGISTSLIRLPAVYGFSDDGNSPWVLNSLCKQWLKEKRVSPRHPESSISLTHRDPLLRYLRDQLISLSRNVSTNTVRYLRPPMLKMSVDTLSKLVEDPSQFTTEKELIAMNIRMINDLEHKQSETFEHLELLKSTIANLKTNDSL